MSPNLPQTVACCCPCGHGVDFEPTGCPFGLGVSPHIGVECKPYIFRWNNHMKVHYIRPLLLEFCVCVSGGVDID